MLNKLNLKDGQSTRLSKQEVFDSARQMLDKAYSDEAGGFEKLCEIWEAAHGYDLEIEYLPSIELFNIFK